VTRAPEPLRCAEQRAGGGVADPPNLIRVMPAKAGTAVHPSSIGSAGAPSGGDGPTRAVVVNGGEDPPRPAVRHLLPAGVLVVAADSGLDHAHALGLDAQVVVGDFDSVSDAALSEARARRATVEQHPAEKEASDLELALAAARAHGASAVTVVSGSGGRLDHLLASVFLLASDEFADLTLDAYVGAAYVAVVRTTSRFEGRVGEPCTLLAAHGPAHGVRTDGLRYPLSGETLLPGSTRGLSNELTSTVATVSVGSGTVLAILPDALSGEENR
jgi:thiamine pyrophosphokinase